MRSGLVLVTMLLCAATACSSSAGSTSTGTTPTPSPAVSTPAAPVTPKTPTAADDAAGLKRALVSAKDLGKPWVQPKAVATVQSKKGEVCPGHVSAIQQVKVTAQTRVNLTQGKGDGKNIATFSLRMLPTESDKAVLAAYAKDQKACAVYTDANGLFVTRSLEGPTTVDRAEVVTAWVERVYTDQAHTQLAYARHSVVTRQGRALTFVSYAFMAPKTDAGATDFTPVTRLLIVQLKKNAKVLS